MRQIEALFYQYPTKEFQLRGISRITRIPLSTVKRYVEALITEKIIKKIPNTIYSSYQANRDSEEFLLKKRLNTIIMLHKSGLIRYLDSHAPECIILFGSASRGEDIENSDIDLYVQSTEVKLSMVKYESVLHRKISVFFAESFNKISDELKNNIINGITLSGYLQAYGANTRNTGQGTSKKHTSNDRTYNRKNNRR